LQADNSKYRPACTPDQDAERLEAPVENASVTRETDGLAEQSMVTLLETLWRTHSAEHSAGLRGMTLLVAQPECQTSPRIDFP
jgi:hypothetical protein